MAAKVAGGVSSTTMSTAMMMLAILPGFKPSLTF